MLGHESELPEHVEDQAMLTKAVTTWPAGWRPARVRRSAIVGAAAETLHVYIYIYTIDIQAPWVDEKNMPMCCFHQFLFHDDATEVVGDLDESEMIDGIKKVADPSSEEHMKKMGRKCGENDVIYMVLMVLECT